MAMNELRNITSANPNEWGDMSDDFRPWAQNRARFTLRICERMLSDEEPTEEKVFLEAKDIHPGSWWEAADNGGYGLVVLSVDCQRNEAKVLGTNGQEREIDTFKLQYRYRQVKPNEQSQRGKTTHTPESKPYDGQPCCTKCGHRHHIGSSCTPCKFLSDGGACVLCGKSAIDTIKSSLAGWANFVQTKTTTITTTTQPSRRFRCSVCGTKCRTSKAGRGKRDKCRACEGRTEH
jgi:hypothetical protein